MAIKCDVCGNEKPMCVHKDFSECDDCEGKTIKILAGLDALIVETQEKVNSDSLCWRETKIILNKLIKIRNGEYDDGY